MSMIKKDAIKKPSLNLPEGMTEEQYANYIISMAKKGTDEYLDKLSDYLSSKAVGDEPMFETVSDEQECICFLMTSAYSALGYCGAKKIGDEKKQDNFKRGYGSAHSDYISAVLSLSSAQVREMTRTLSPELRAVSSMYLSEKEESEVKAELDEWFRWSTFAVIANLKTMIKTECHDSRALRELKWTTIDFARELVVACDFAGKNDEKKELGHLERAYIHMMVLGAEADEAEGKGAKKVADKMIEWFNYVASMLITANDVHCSAEALKLEIAKLKALAKEDGILSGKIFEDILKNVEDGNEDA